MRKALTYGVFLIVCGASIGTVDGAYVIKLKNGNEYVTTRYWREGKQVLFETYDGVFGIDKLCGSSEPPTASPPPNRKRTR